ncbi:MAG: hypothetical protein NTW50_05230 [Candidatus Berkelbacteria bacterium]|nr:hypothetical protein [Candidatus Berkelbacteria bacterium]
MPFDCKKISQIVNDLSQMEREFSDVINASAVQIAREKKVALAEKVSEAKESIYWKYFGQISSVTKDIETIWELNQLSDKMRFSMKITPDGRSIVTLAAKDKLKFCDLKTGEVTGYLEAPTNMTGDQRLGYFFDGDFNIVFRPDWNLLFILVDRYSNTVDKRVQRKMAVYDLDENRLLKKEDLGCSGAFAYDEEYNRMASCGYNRKILADWQNFEDVPEEMGYPKTMEFSDDGKYLLGFDCEKHLVIWDCETGKVKTVLEAIRSYAFDGKRKIYTSHFRRAELYSYDLETGQESTVMDRARAFALAIDREFGNLIVSSKPYSDKDKTSEISVIKMATGEIVHKFIVEDNVRTIEVGADDMIAFGCGYKNIEVYGKSKSVSQ